MSLKENFHRKQVGSVSPLRTTSEPKALEMQLNEILHYDCPSCQAVTSLTVLTIKARLKVAASPL